MTSSRAEVSIRARPSASRLRRSTTIEARPGTAVGIPGSNVISPTVPTPFSPMAISSIHRGGGRDGQPSVMARVHRCRARMRDPPADREPEPLHPDAAADGGRLDALRLQNRPLLDVELQVGVDPLEPRAGLEHAVELDAVLGQHPGGQAAVGVPGAAQLCQVEGARDRRAAAEQAAAEAGALLVRPVHKGQRPGRARAGGRPGAEHAEGRHHPKGAVQPAPFGTSPGGSRPRAPAPCSPGR